MEEILKAEVKDDYCRKYKSGTYIAYHSCGSMYQVITDLIEIGINVLNPIQPRAKGMNALDIKKEFGSKITLICGLDTQEFIRKSSPSSVMEKTKKTVKQLGKKGGYIFAVSHSLQPDVLLEKIIAMLKGLNS